MLISLLFVKLVLSACTTFRENVEWREMTLDEQKSFLDAVKCLKSKPSKILNNEFEWDELTYAHAQVASSIHNHPVFLPWHRQFIQIMDRKLIDSCGYSGKFPYWDEQHDSQAPELSPLWELFGGNGESGDHCVVDGRLANMMSSYPSKHCVAREWSGASQGSNQDELMASFYSPAQVALILASPDYDNFRENLENNLHNMVHVGIGGDMYDPTTSPGDPMFFMHHRNVDRLWWVWQQQDPNNRLMQYQSTDSITATMPSFSGLSKNYLISDVMDITNGGADGSMCVKYSNSITPDDNDAYLQAPAPPVYSPAPPVYSPAPPVYSPAPPVYSPAPPVYSPAPPVYSPAPPVYQPPAHPPKYRGGKCKAKPKHVSSSAYDRKDLDHIRHVEPIPYDFLKRWNYKDEDIQKIRLYEDKVRHYTDYINSLPVHHYGTLRQLHHGKKHGYRSKTKEEHDYDHKVLIDRVETYHAQYGH